MRREAWEAMNTVIANNQGVGHQTVSDTIVECLHKAGFVIVPHEITDNMLIDGGTVGEGDECYRDWYKAALANCIQNRQQSEN